MLNFSSRQWEGLHALLQVRQMHAYQGRNVKYDLPLPWHGSLDFSGPLTRFRFERVDKEDGLEDHKILLSLLLPCY